MQCSTLEYLGIFGCIKIRGRNRCILIASPAQFLCVLYIVSELQHQTNHDTNFHSGFGICLCAIPSVPSGAVTLPRQMSGLPSLRSLFSGTSLAGLGDLLKGPPPLKLAKLEDVASRVKKEAKRQYIRYGPLTFPATKVCCNCP
jgi:hypothetical protein